MHILRFFTKTYYLCVHAFFFKIVHKFFGHIIITNDHYFSYEIFLVTEVMTDHQVDEPVYHQHNTHARQCNGDEYARQAKLLEKIQVQHNYTEPAEINACCAARKHFEAVNVFFIVYVAYPANQHPREVQEKPEPCVDDEIFYRDRFTQPKLRDEHNEVKRDEVKPCQHKL